MKKILILGGSHRDIPLIKAAQELGYYVITLGAREYYLGHKYSDKYYLIDFNDLDVVKKIYIKENIDYLLPGCGEQSYLNTVKLSHQLHIGNFDTLEIAQLIHDKWQFKEFCLANKISTPKGTFYHKKFALDALKLPIVVKPTNLSGGRGIKVVHTIADLKTALSEAKKYSNEIFLEEFIEGELFAYSVFFINKKIIYDFFGKDDMYLNPYLVTTAYPAKIENRLLQILKDELEVMARTLDIVDGMFHAQVIMKNKKLYIIDVTRRIPGDFYPNLIEFCDNIAYSKAVVQSYTTGKVTVALQKSQQYFVIRHCVMPSQNGLYTNIFIDETLKDKIIYRFDLMPLNSLIENYLYTQIAIVFIKLDKSDFKICDNIHTLIYPILT